MGERGVPAERIVVGGFSQGGFIASRAAFSFPDAPLGGLLMLATFLGGGEVVLAPAQKNLRVLVMHGDADDLVAFEWGKENFHLVQTLLPEASLRFEAYEGINHVGVFEEVFTDPKKGILGRDLRKFVEEFAKPK